MTNLKDAISLDLIKTFAVFAEVGSVDLAAESLGLTQAAVSFQLKRLEKEMGQSLFQTLGRRKVLNTFGLDLFQQLAPPLKNLESALKEVSAKTKASHRPSLRLQCDPLLVLAFNSRIEISAVVEFDSSNRDSDFSSNSRNADVWFSVEPSRDKQKFLSKKICDFELVVASVSKDIDFSKEPVFHSSVCEYLQQGSLLQELKIQPRLISSDWFQVQSAIRKQKTWTIVPDFVVDEINLKKVETSWWSPVKQSIYCISPSQLGPEIFAKVSLKK